MPPPQPKRYSKRFSGHQARTDLSLACPTIKCDQDCRLPSPQSATGEEKAELVVDYSTPLVTGTASGKGLNLAEQMPVATIPTLKWTSKKYVLYSHLLSFHTAQSEISS